jgi:CRISPR-associated protein Csd2
MSTLQNKIDFAVILRVKNANPNGDPLNSNRPRTNYENFGEITDVCIKRKIRDRLVERFQNLQKEGKPTKGQAVFVQSDDRKIDDATSLRDRAEKYLSPLEKRLGLRNG